MLAQIVIDEDICKGCGLCTITCPRTLLKLSDETGISGYNPATITSQDKCTGCALCAGMCPALAINVYSRKLNEFTVNLMPEYQILYKKINYPGTAGTKKAD
jgi:2-oxoglutarate ferredoxin oxidoreductase subunit delta